MTHNEVYKHFLSCMPMYKEAAIKVWFPNGKNSIRIRLTQGNEFVFTFYGPRDWRFETVEYFFKDVFVKKGG